jgi:hypothetical protein
MLEFKALFGPLARTIFERQTPVRRAWIEFPFRANFTRALAR